MAFFGLILKIRRGFTRRLHPQLTLPYYLSSLLSQPRSQSDHYSPVFSTSQTPDFQALPCPASHQPSNAAQSP